MKRPPETALLPNGFVDLWEAIDIAGRIEYPMEWTGEEFTAEWDWRYRGDLERHARWRLDILSRLPPVKQEMDAGFNEAATLEALKAELQEEDRERNRPVLDGVYHTSEGATVFQPVRAPSAEQLHMLLHQIIKHVMKLLTRRGYLIEEQGMVYLAETDSSTAMTPLQSAACTYRIAFGLRAGQKVLSLQSIPSFDAQHTKQRCVNEQRFSLHAEVRCAMNQRKKLEKLCRYITRPAIANERLSTNKNGDVVLRLKSPYQDGTTHVVMSPLEFMQRLAALVPRPRLNLIRFHGVLAPNAKLCPQIIPGKPASVPDDLGEASHHPTTAHMSWARLLKRVFDIDIERCPHCGGSLKIIAAIEDPEVITKILAHLGLPTRAPPRTPARSLDLFATP